MPWCVKKTCRQSLVFCLLLQMKLNWKMTMLVIYQLFWVACTTSAGLNSFQETIQLANSKILSGPLHTTHTKVEQLFR